MKVLLGPGTPSGAPNGGVRAAAADSGAETKVVRVLESPKSVASEESAHCKGERPLLATALLALTHALLKMDRAEQEER